MPIQSGERSLARAVATPRSRAAFRKAGRMSVGRDQLLNVLEMTLEPVLLVAALWAVALQQVRPEQPSVRASYR